MTTDAFEFIMCGCIVYECLLIRGLLCSCTEEQFYTDHPTVIGKLLFCFFSKYKCKFTQIKQPNTVLHI